MLEIWKYLTSLDPLATPIGHGLVLLNFSKFCTLNHLNQSAGYS